MITKTPRYSSKQSMESLPEDFFTDEPNTNEKKTATKHPFIALLAREEKNKDAVFRLFFRLSAHFRPHSCAIFFIQIPHIIFCCPLSAYDKGWLEQKKKSPHFREKYLVLSYLNRAPRLKKLGAKREEALLCGQLLHTPEHEHHRCIDDMITIFFFWKESRRKNKETMVQGSITDHIDTSREIHRI